ncbi:unnamed protein product [Brugia timori]|uniref:Transposase n=1 Tax=Brugia timori TaxID=42155 RepID=A0A0R3QD78_9BILA|nr:unnamed protein product [Brugia timori]
MLQKLSTPKSCEVLSAITQNSSDRLDGTLLSALRHPVTGTGETGK